VIYIKQGRRTITGHNTSGWTVHIPGQRAIGCRELSEAKDAAVTAGASGMWRREVRPTGERGRDETHYFDTNEKGTP